MHPRGSRHPAQLRADRSRSFQLQTPKTSELDFEQLGVTLAGSADRSPDGGTDVDHLAVRSHGSSPGKRRPTSRGYAALIHPADDKNGHVYARPVILEVDKEAIRDIAAAIHAARKREPSIEILAALERKALAAIQQKSVSLELTDDEARALRNVLQRRAYDQRNTTEGTDYMDLAERISNDLDTDEPPLITTEAGDQ